MCGPPTHRKNLAYVERGGMALDDLIATLQGIRATHSAEYALPGDVWVALRSGCLEIFRVWDETEGERAERIQREQTERRRQYKELKAEFESATVAREKEAP